MTVRRESNDHRSIWLREAPRTAHPPLTESRTADVVVVGGGIAGLSTALRMQRDGLRVALLEADRIGCGVTGGSTAKVTSLHGTIYAHIERFWDTESARLYAEANESGLESIAGLAEEFSELGIDCRFERQAAYTFTCEEDRVEEIRAEAEAAARAGLPATFTTETELPFEVRGAVRVENQGQFDPYHFCLGLALGFVEAGGTIHEETRVTDVANDGDDACRVITAQGEVRCGHVVVTTLLPILDRGGFFTCTAASRSYGIAVTLVGNAPEGMYLGVDSPTRSVRPLADRRGIIVVGEQHEVGQDTDTRDRYASLEEWARRWFPVRTVDHRWSAQDYLTADSLPYIGRMPRGGDRIWTATGFNKWGLTTSAAAAAILTALVRGREHPWAGLFDSTRLSPVASAKRFVTENANVVKRFVGDRLRAMSAPALEELQPGDGGIVVHDGRKLAAFRDEAGVVHACDPVCTHLGCFVQWNTAERSWDCPCHGSRFDTRGAILQGPAVEPLEYRTLAGDESP